MRLALLLTPLITAGWACATAPPTPRQPDVLPTRDSLPSPAPRVLGLQSGSATYVFTQSSEIRPESPLDTMYSTVAMEAVFLVTVTSQADSIHEISVSIDSIRITSGGPAAAGRTQGPSAPVSLGAVLRASFGPGSRDAEILLPDSLCAYGQLVGAVQELLLWPLPSTPLLVQNGMWADSSRFSTCRAGAIVETKARQTAMYSVTQPNELALRTTATIQGAGVMRTDSVTVTGTVTSSGKAVLDGNSRLPSFIRSSSQGVITVRLADSTTVFRQQSTQEWQRRAPN
jgi:hypothetical protein